MLPLNNRYIFLAYLFYNIGFKFVCIIMKNTNFLHPEAYIQRLRLKSQSLMSGKVKNK